VPHRQPRQLRRAGHVRVVEEEGPEPGQDRRHHDAGLRPRGEVCARDHRRPGGGHLHPHLGGHAGSTILPLFSQDKASATIAADKIPDLDKKVQDAGTVVVSAKAGKGSATLSMGYAGARLGSSVLAGLAGTPTTECTYVMSSVTELPYFASKVTFDRIQVEMLSVIAFRPSSWQAAGLPLSVRRPEVRGGAVRPGRHLQDAGRGLESGPCLQGRLRDLADQALGIQLPMTTSDSRCRPPRTRLRRPGGASRRP
jgi:hypothetical protein